MKTHYILADDYDRWNPGEPIEDVASDKDYLLLVMLQEQDYSLDGWERFSGLFKKGYFDNWLLNQIQTKSIYKITTDTEGRILP